MKVTGVKTYVIENEPSIRINTLKGGMEGDLNDKGNNIILSTKGDTLNANVSSMDQTVHEFVMAYLQLETKPKISFGGEEVDLRESFSNIGIEDGGILTISLEDLSTVEEVIDTIIDMNPEITKENLIERIVIPNLDNISQDVFLNSYISKIVFTQINLSELQLTILPDSFCNITVSGDLRLNHNQLKSLPDSFGNNIKVGRDLFLNHNQLVSLPTSFGNIRVGGSVGLGYNQLKSLPESFGNIRVGRHLGLPYNQLTSLPESFGNIRVGGSVYLYENKLESLPESFCNIRVGGNVYLYENKLESLPVRESYHNLKGDIINYKI